MKVLLNWYQTLRDKNGVFTPYGGIDGSGLPGNEKRFGNSGGVSGAIISTLLPDKNNLSEFGRYEELLIENKDDTGSKTPNLKTPNVNLLDSLNNFAIQKGWKV